MMRLTVLAIVLVSVKTGFGARAADWPQFRYDAARTAASPEELSAELHLQWVRKLPTPRPAFPGEVRLRFDASYEPVVLGQTMFVPSMVTGGVMALDTATGTVRWEYLTEGPVRFAPVAWQDRVYFVSDDGHLYCVEAASGNLLWKFNGRPPGRDDRQLMGSGRLISLWPARGGPVIQDGVLYFAAGIWSTYGVCVHALDAATGKPIWSNSDSNQIPEANMDHGIANFAGLSPQGYLAIVDGKLVVPCGAHLPAFLDLKTGALDTFCMGWGGRNGLPKGTWFVAGAKSYLSSGGDLYDLRRRNDEQFAEPMGRSNFKPRLYAGQFTRVWIDPTNQKDLGAFDEPVFAGDTWYANDAGVVAYDLAAGRLEERSQAEIPAVRRDDTYPDKWQMRFPELWRLATRLQAQLRAGRHLYLSGPGCVEAVRVPAAGEEPQVVWRATVDGTPRRMLAADGKLFVVTLEGQILAFGGEEKPQPLVHALPEAPASQPDSWTKTTEEILAARGAREGYALVLGAGSGRLVEELIRQSELHVVVIESDAAKAAALREQLHQAGWNGARATVKVGEPLTYPLPPYFASLVVAEDWSQVGATATEAWVGPIYHTLRPYGGSACLELAGPVRDAAVRHLTERPLESAEVRQEGDRLIVSRVGPLPESAAWSHAEADAANTGASEDRFIRAPMELLWFDGPPRWIRTPGATLVRVCAGRMLIKANKLEAFDVYTGRPLWEASFPFAHSVNDQMVAVDDAIYVTGGRDCLVLDPRDGRTTRRIELPAELAAPWANLRVLGDYLLGQSGKHLVCFHRATGELAWIHECSRASLSLALGGGKAFCAELADRRRGESEDDVKTRALDLGTGQRLWEIAGGSDVRYSRELDAVVLRSGVYRAADGSLLAALPKPPEGNGQTPPEKLPRPLFVIGPRLLFGTLETYAVYDLSTGERSSESFAWVRRGCTVPRASANLLTTRVRGNAACIDLASQDIIPFWNVRAACSNNLFPADGVLNMPSLTGGCTCNYLPVSQAYVPASAMARTAH